MASKPPPSSSKPKAPTPSSTTASASTSKSRVGAYSPTPAAAASAVAAAGGGGAAPASELGVPYAFKYVTEAIAREWNKSSVVPSKLTQDLTRAWNAYANTKGDMKGKREGGKVFRRIILELAAQTSATLLKTESAITMLHTLYTVYVAKEESNQLKELFWTALADTFATAYIQLPLDRKKGVIGLVKEAITKNVLKSQIVETLMSEDAVGDLRNYEQAAREMMRKKLVMFNTGRLYKQNRFNLLHEESEGYSKVLTALDELSDRTVQHTIIHLYSLIGYFDLDPNRVADLVLDSFEADTSNTAHLRVLKEGNFRKEYLAQLTGHKFLRYQPADASAATTSTPSSGEAQAASAAPPSTTAAAVGTTTTPTPSNKKTPSSLFNLAAILLAKGLIDLSALLPHLKPELPQVIAKQASERASRFVSTNQNGAMAPVTKGPVEAPPAKGTASQGEEAQVLELLAAVIRTKHWTAVAKIWKYLEATGLHPIESRAVSQAMLGLVSHVISGLKHLASPMGLVRREKIVLVGGTGKEAVEERSEGGKKAGGGEDMMDIGGSTSNSTEPEEAGLVTVPSDIRDLPAALAPLLAFLGPYLADDVVLYTRVVRLLKEYYNQYGSSLFTASWDEHAFINETPFGQCLASSIVPSVTLTPCNPGLIAEVWDLLSPIPYRYRYTVYNAWKALLDLKSPWSRLVVAECRALNSAKYSCRMVTVDTVKELIRPFARQMHSSPLMVFNHIMTRIEGLDGGILNTWVECLKLLNNLALDVGSYVLLQRASDGRPMLQRGSPNESPHFKALATFTGFLYKRYPQLEVLGLLEHLIDMLRGRSSEGLHLLHEILNKMGGMPGSYEEGLTENIIRGRGGGDTLKMETALFGLREKVSNKAIKRLREVVLSKSVGGPLLLLLANQRHHIIFDEELTNGSVKDMWKAGALFDKCSSVFIQLSEFAGAGKLSEKYASMIPSLEDMVLQLQMDPEVAFHLIRPMLRAALKQRDDSSTPVVDGISVQALLTQWDPFSESMRKRVGGILPKETWTHLSPHLYLAFWSLSLYDIDVPESLYLDEIKRLESSIKTLLRNIDAEDTARDGLLKSDKDIAKERDRKKKEIKESEASIRALKEELAVQKMHHASITNLIKGLKAHLFPTQYKSETTLYEHLHTLLQHLVLPRAALSPEDAMYTARFFHFLHILDMPNFPSLRFFDLMIRGLIPFVFSATDQEALNLGIFIKTLLSPLYTWAQSRATFETEGSAKEGVKDYYRNRNLVGGENEHEKYQKLFGKWEKRIWHAMLTALGQGQPPKDGYKAGKTVTIAALRCMQQMVDVFPYSRHIGEGLLKAVGALQTKMENEQDKQDPVVVVARGYCTILAPRIKALKETRKPEEVKRDRAAEAAAAAAAATPARAESPSMMQIDQDVKPPTPKRSLSRESGRGGEGGGGDEEAAMRSSSSSKEAKATKKEKREQQRGSGDERGGGGGGREKERSSKEKEPKSERRESGERKDKGDRRRGTEGGPAPATTATAAAAPANSSNGGEASKPPLPPSATRESSRDKPSTSSITPAAATVAEEGGRKQARPPTSTVGAVDEAGRKPSRGGDQGGERERRGGSLAPPPASTGGAPPLASNSLEDRAAARRARFEKEKVTGPPGEKVSSSSSSTSLNESGGSNRQDASSFSSAAVGVVGQKRDRDDREKPPRGGGGSNFSGQPSSSNFLSTAPLSSAGTDIDASSRKRKAGFDDQGAALGGQGGGGGGEGESRGGGGRSQSPSRESKRGRVDGEGGGGGGGGSSSRGGGGRPVGGYGTLAAGDGGGGGRRGGDDRGPRGSRRR